MLLPCRRIASLCTCLRPALQHANVSVSLLPYQVTKEEYGQYGGPALGEKLAAQLRDQGLNPYVIPVGGSSSTGVWG